VAQSVAVVTFTGTNGTGAIISNGVVDVAVPTGTSLRVAVRIPEPDLRSAGHGPRSGAGRNSLVRSWLRRRQDQAAKRAGRLGSMAAFLDLSVFGVEIGK